MKEQITAGEIVAELESLAPLTLAEEWDNSGWQIGDPNAPVKRVAFALDVHAEVVKKAQEMAADLLITHHPFFFKPIKHIRFDQASGSLVRQLIQQKIMLYSAHTNFDHAPHGVSHILGEKIGLQHLQVFGAKQHERLFKLVVFVPMEEAEAVCQAICANGAGFIGNYSHCTFQTSGQGTFLPRVGSNPYVGTLNQLEKVVEQRLETLVPQSKLSNVLKAMFAAHPYEEVAYDLYALEIPGAAIGPGCLGFLPKPLTLRQLAEKLKADLNAPGIRLYGNPDLVAERIALCGGSGAFLIPAAAQQGAEVLITGDVKYHEVQEALERGLAVMDAGHGPTEFPAVEYLAKQVQEKFPLLFCQVIQVLGSERWI